MIATCTQTVSTWLAATSVSVAMVTLEMELIAVSMYSH